MVTTPPLGDDTSTGQPRYASHRSFCPARAPCSIHPSALRTVCCFQPESAAGTSPTQLQPGQWVSVYAGAWGPPPSRSTLRELMSARLLRVMSL